ncbi:hypothetical protein AUP68_05621 [Ilyonectria robusta]
MKLDSGTDTHHYSQVNAMQLFDVFHVFSTSVHEYRPCIIYGSNKPALILPSWTWNVSTSTDTRHGRIRGTLSTSSVVPAMAPGMGVCRSLERLATPYLDLVYTHDVEFVSPQEVLAAVTELRKLRDQGLIRYVGISGYPVDTLAALAEMILRETGEPLDAVLSYSHFCVQNSRLGEQHLLDRFRSAGVECLLNASMLSMGLLTSRGVDNSPMGAWHPAPQELRQACDALATIARDEGEHLEEISIRWALENWARTGSPFGTKLIPTADRDSVSEARLGVSVMGVSSVAELEETWALWSSVAGLAGEPEQQAAQRTKIARIVKDKMWPSLGRWKDYAWESGGPSFVNARAAVGSVPRDAVSERWGLIPSVRDTPKI